MTLFLLMPAALLAEVKPNPETVIYSEITLPSADSISIEESDAELKNYTDTYRIDSEMVLIVGSGIIEKEESWDQWVEDRGPRIFLIVMKDKKWNTVFRSSGSWGITPILHYFKGNSDGPAVLLAEIGDQNPRGLRAFLIHDRTMTEIGFMEVGIHNGRDCYEEGNCLDSAYPFVQVKRVKRDVHITFKKPVVGPDGEKLDRQGFKYAVDKRIFSTF